MEVALSRLREFEEVLEHYHVSDSAKEVLDGLQLVLFMGPTATGRNTIMNELLKTGHYYFIVSDTTRPPKIRNGVLEKNGESYFFRSEEAVLQDLKEGNFLEAEIIHNQQVSGISMRELQRAKAMRKIACTDVDMNSSIIREAKPDTITLFVIPPHFDEWFSRIENRGGTNPDELLRRLETALQMYDIVEQDTQYVLLVNDDLHDTVRHVESFVNDGCPAREEQVVELEIMRQLRVETKAYIDRLARK